MIKVKIKGVADVANLIGGLQQVHSIPENSSFDDLLNVLFGAYGQAFKQRLDKGDIRILINGRDLDFAGGSKAILQDEDEITFIPPLFGG